MVLLLSIIDKVAHVSEDLLIENVEGSMCMVEDEKQLQKLNTSLSHLLKQHWRFSMLNFNVLRWYPFCLFFNPISLFLVTPYSISFFSKIIALLLPIPIWNRGLSNV